MSADRNSIVDTNSTFNIGTSSSSSSQRTPRISQAGMEDVELNSSSHSAPSRNLLGTGRPYANMGFKRPNSSTLTADSTDNSAQPAPSTHITRPNSFREATPPPPPHRKFANPAPLGLCAFALTTFVLSAVNLGTRGVSVPNIAVPLALGYGGLVQLLAGMWEMAVGNTFGATALSSYGGFWLAYGVLLTPAWNILGPGGAYGADPHMASSAVGLFLTGWFVFTTVMLLCTLRTDAIFCGLFFTLDVTFLLLLTAEFAASEGSAEVARGLTRVAGGTGVVTAFLAWYYAFVGLAESIDAFFIPPVFPFPWSDKGREERARRKTERETA